MLLRPANGLLGTAAGDREVVPVGRAVLPGPVDGRRLLWRALRPGSLEGDEGAVRAG